MKVQRIRQKCCFVVMLMGLVFIFFFGLAMCFAYLPEVIERDGMVEKAMKVHLGRSLKKQIMDLIPNKPRVEHWTPISISGSMLKLCQLDFKRYSEQPYNYPMFKDLLELSECSFPDKTKSINIDNILSDIRANAGTPSGRVVYPTGFIFHESRVGSTLIANMLASDQNNMVFSESSIGASLFHLDIEAFRNVMTILGRSPTHQRMFFKFQSKYSANMKKALEAYPDVPWLFIFRKPVEVMMSHMDPMLSVVSGFVRVQPPCLRTRGSRASKTILSPFISAKDSIPDEAWCSAYLASLCSAAMSAHAEYGAYPNNHSSNSVTRRGISMEKGSVLDRLSPRGFLAEYSSLPGIFPFLLETVFGVDVTGESLESMLEVSSQYSKSRKWYYPKAGHFRMDSGDKSSRATTAIRHWSSQVLDPLYLELSTRSRQGYKALRSRNQALPGLEGGNFNWSAVSDLPSSREWMARRDSPSMRFTSDANFLHKAYNPFSATFHSDKHEEVSCPPRPSADYPRAYPIKDLLDNWNPDDTTIPPKHYDSFCRFHYREDKAKIEAYRKAEVPFVIRGVPEVERAAQRWSDVDYLNEQLGPYVPYLSETSSSNHFMFARGKSYTDQLVLMVDGPTGVTMITFEEWLREAVAAHNRSLGDVHHKYFRFTAFNPERHWLYEELPIFKPDSQFFHTGAVKGKGINCRFGMTGIIAECHYDGTPNFVASLGGLRRWIMAHPSECKHLHLLEKDSVSSRHSQVDWSNPDYEKYPQFIHAKANELIMQPGEVLFVPAFWFHFIASLNVNFQCNCRAGRGRAHQSTIHKCGNF